jgi:hypothetical protein
VDKGGGPALERGRWASLAYLIGDDYNYDYKQVVGNDDYDDYDYYDVGCPIFFVSTFFASRRRTS